VVAKGRGRHDAHFVDQLARRGQSPDAVMHELLGIKRGYLAANRDLAFGYFNGDSAKRGHMMLRNRGDNLLAQLAVASFVGGFKNGKHRKSPSKSFFGS